MLFLLPSTMAHSKTKENKDIINKFGGSDIDCFSSAALTMDGGCIAVGYSYSNDGDMNGLSKSYIEVKSDFIGVYDAIIVKYNKSGNIEWKNSFGGSYGDEFKFVAATEDGGCIAVGYSYSKDGDMNGLCKKGEKYYCDAIIVKYDKYGNIEWKRNFGGEKKDVFYYVVVEDDGGYKAIGNSFSNDGDMEELCKNKEDNSLTRIMVKYDKNGNIEWKKIFNFNKEDIFNSVIETKDEGYIVVGTTKTQNESYDALIIKYDKEGNIEWRKSFGGNKEDSFNSVALTDDGGYIVVGYSELNNGESKRQYGEGFDAIIVKYNQLGDVEWKRSFGENNIGDTFTNVVLAKDGGYVTIHNLYGYSNTSIVKYNNVGDIEWCKVFDQDGKDYEMFKSLIVTEEGNYIAVGKVYQEYGDDDVNAVICIFGTENSSNMTENPIIFTSIKLNKNSLILKKGSKYKLTAMIIPSNAINKNFIWTTSNSKIVKVDTNGNITAVGKGTAIITVKTVRGEYKDTCKITVK